MLFPPAVAAAGTAAAGLAPVEGEVIVRLKSDSQLLRRHALAACAPAADVNAVLARRAELMASRTGRNLRTGSAVGEGMQVLRASGVDSATLARELAADPEVEFAEPNGRKRRLVAPNDPLYAESATGLRPLVTDNLGNTARNDLGVAVAGLPPSGQPVLVPQPVPDAGGGGGGGAMSWPWLALLGLAVLALRRRGGAPARAPAA